MLNGIKLVADTFSEIYEYIKPWCDDYFWDFREHLQGGRLQSGACYVIGRNQMRMYWQEIRSRVEQGEIQVIFSNPSEGSDTMRGHCEHYRIHDLVRRGLISLISGGDLDSNYRYLLYENLAVKILDFDSNLQAMTRTPEIFSRVDKPYKFLFLNGRRRTNRKYLLERFQAHGLLDQSLWTNLDNSNIQVDYLTCYHQGNDLMVNAMPVHLLPPQYEVERYRNNVSTLVPGAPDLAAKHHLFNQEWGEIYLNADAYIDTYFSVVAETVFVGPGSFRTEKIWKPVAMGHPFVVSANAGFYRDFRNLGFRTFDHVMDESFDGIDNHQDRIERMAQVVEDLCQQDLGSFVKECYNVCMHNQQHLAQIRDQAREKFPNQFAEFVVGNFGKKHE